MIIDKEISLHDVLNKNELEMVCEAISDYITNETGYCPSAFLASFKVVADLDDEGENES